MNMNELESNYLNNRIAKQEYISKMYSTRHDILFEYSEFIRDRDIQKIEITDDSVIITSREFGIKMVCTRYDERIAPIETLNMKFYEKKDSDMIVSLVKDGDTVFDVGGNIGWYSVVLYKARKNIELHVFEPIPSTYESLIANLKINGVKASAYNIGLSDKKGSIDFYFHKEGSGNASAALMNENRKNIQIACEVDTLDNIFRENKVKKINFIKCDVEGAELLTFKGAYETIKKYKPIVFTEMLRKWSAKFNYHPNEIINLFSEIGYSCYYAENNQLVKIDEMTDDTTETNFFFLYGH